MDTNTIAILALFTGGLAGAVFKSLWDWGKDRRTRKVLAVVKHVIDYSIPAELSSTDLKVSYKNKSYDRLSYYELRVLNSGRTTVKASEFYVTIGENAIVIERYGAATPENLTYEIHGDAKLPKRKLVFEHGTLRPGDSVRLGLLVANSSSFDYDYRGDDDVIVKRVSDDADSAESLLLSEGMAIAGSLVGSSTASGVVLAARVVSRFLFKEESERFPSTKALAPLFSAGPAGYHRLGTKTAPGSPGKALPPTANDGKGGANTAD